MSAKLTRKQAHRLLRSIGQNLAGAQQATDAGKPIPDVDTYLATFGKPDKTGQSGEDAQLMAKLLGRLTPRDVAKQSARAQLIGKRAWRSNGQALWGASFSMTGHRGKRYTLNLEDAWRALEILAPMYGMNVLRPTKHRKGIDAPLPVIAVPGEMEPGSKQDRDDAIAAEQAARAQATGVPAPTPAPAATPQPSVTIAVADPNAQGGEIDIHKGTALPGLRDTPCKKLPDVGTSTPPPFPHAPALSRALASYVRPHARRTEDGDELHNGAACAIAARLREPMMTTHVRARTGAPAVQLYIDQSGSMNSSLDLRAMDVAAECANAILESCRLARVPIQCLGFDDVGASGLKRISDFDERRMAKPRNYGGTDLPRALQTGMPWLAARREPRRLVLVITDGEVGVGPPLQAARLAADRMGIELYAIGLGVHVQHGPGAFHGSVRIDRAEDLLGTAARELARVVGRGEAMAS